MKVNLTVVSLAALLIIACLVLKGKGFTGPIPGRRGQFDSEQVQSICETARRLGCEKIQKTATFENRYKNK